MFNLKVSYFGFGGKYTFDSSVWFSVFVQFLFSGSRAVTDICQKLKEFPMAMIIMKTMKLIFIEGNIFLTSLCMISLFSCHSGKQGCGRYLSKTQRISNNIKIVLHPSLQAAISFSCCFSYHWKFSSNIFLIISFAQLTKDFSSFSVCSC